MFDYRLLIDLSVSVMIVPAVDFESCISTYLLACKVDAGFFDLVFNIPYICLSYLFQLGVCILPLLVFAACAPMAIIQI